MEKKNWSILVTVLLALAVLGALAYGAKLAYTSEKPARELPIFKPLGVDTLPDGTLEAKFHKVPAFSFVNQDGKTITQDVMKGKVAVVDFFFTTCQTICPIMTDELGGIDSIFSKRKDFVILSHTVDPETDTVAQLKAYAAEKGITNPNWHLLTGDKAALYKQAREGYFLDASIGNGGPDDFVHTQLFALIDKEGRIRGYYDGTSKEDMKRLSIDLDLLYQYYEWAGK